MRIGIDCRLAGKQHAGIGRYIENLVIRLPVMASEIHWVFFFFDQAQADEIVAKIPEKYRISLEIQLAPIRHYSIKEQLDLPRIFSQAKLDLLHVPHFNIPLFYRGKMIVTIHDLLWHEYKGTHVTTLPAWQYWIKHRIYQWVVGQAVKNAVAILVPAKTIQNTIVKYYPLAKNKITVTSEGIDDAFLKSVGRSATSVGTPTPQTGKNKELLYVGSLYPHKNIRVIINALKKLPGYRLVIVGTRNIFQDQVKDYTRYHGLETRVQFVGYLPDEKLLQLYQQSFALVQPSLSEGFGLTGVEAMAAGVPVIASDIPLFHEVYQEGAFFFNPQESDDFIKALQRLSQANRAKIIQRGKRIAKGYSWQNMVKETVSVYKSAFSKKSYDSSSS
jgi:glycosyltransferase involved in cell wall biosynthesis